MTLSTFKRRVVWPVASIALGLCLAEIVGRTMLMPLVMRCSGDRTLKEQLANPTDLGTMSLYVPHHYYLYYPRPNYRSDDGQLSHNSFGCRGDEVPVAKSPEVYRIIAVGGSTTYSTGVRNNKNIYTYRLQRSLNRWAQARHLHKTFQVINCGVPGYTSAETLSRYIYSLSDYRPDLVMIQQGLNDTIPRSLPELHRDYRDFSKTWNLTDTDTYRFFLVRLAHMVRHRMTSNMYYQGINGLVRYPFWNAAKSGASNANYVKNSPWVFESNTRYLVRLVRGDGAKPLLLTEHLVTDGPAPWPNLPEGRQKGTLEHNDVLAKVAGQEHALFLDLEPTFARRADLMPDGRHLNEWGDALKAQIIFNYLTALWSKNGIPQR